MRFYWLALAVLAVWRLTYMLQAEDGPWDLLRRLRKAAEGRFWGRLLGCFDCLSLWVSAPFAALLGRSLLERLLLWPALSAAAILALRATERPLVLPPALYHEEADGMLRKGEPEPVRAASERT